MTIAPPVLAVRCHYCSRFRSPSEVHEMGTGGVLICGQCLEWHEKAAAYLTQNTPPPGCQECGASLLSIMGGPNPDSGGNNRLWLVPKDGIYQVLCSQCREAYEQKRADLFGSTDYGRKKGIGR